MRITEQEHEARRQRMLHTAYTLFQERGIDGVSMPEIAQAAGVSRNSLFRYFESKAELLRQTQLLLWAQVVELISADNRSKLQSCATGLEEMEVILASFELLYKQYSHYMLFAYEYKAYLVRKQIQLPESSLERSLHQLRDTFLHALERGQTDGSIKNITPPCELFTMLWSIMRFYVEQLVVHNCVYEGKNTWELMFPRMVGYVLAALQENPPILPYAGFENT